MEKRSGLRAQPRTMQTRFPWTSEEFKAEPLYTWARFTATAVITAVGVADIPRDDNTGLQNPCCSSIPRSRSRQRTATAAVALRLPRGRGDDPPRGFDILTFALFRHDGCPNARSQEKQTKEEHPASCGADANAKYFAQRLL